MPMAYFHQVDPDGEVNLILQRPEEPVSYLDSVLERIPTPPRLDFRRSNIQEPPWPTKRGKKGNKRGWELEPQVYIEKPAETELPHEESSAEREPEPVPEALGRNLLPETPTIAEVEALEAPKEPSVVASVGSVPIKKDTASISHPNSIRIQVSSKHLVLASSYFKRNLESGMSESHTLRSEGCVDFRMNDKDPEAMLIVMNVIHGRTRQVPRCIDLDMLTKIAVLVDYLECYEAIEPFSDRWIDGLKWKIAVTYSKALIQWLCISLIFHKEGQFMAITRTAIRQTKGPIQTLGLPIPGGVVGEWSHCHQKQADTDAYP